MVEQQEFCSIAFDFLYPGMRAPDDIFNYSGKTLLVKSGDFLDASKILRIKKFNNGKQNIVVSKKTYDIMINNVKKNSHLTQEYIELETGYHEIQKNVNNFLENVKENEKVNFELISPVTASVYSKISLDTSGNILQCLSTPRPVTEDLERHCLNVSILNGFMGKWLKLSQKDLNLLMLSGLVHDVGKTKVPQEILDAPRALTDEEFAVIKNHPIYSYDLLSEDSSFEECVKLAARHHHEKYKGGGYPDKLTGEQIPLFAKITAISDVYDAMVSKRSYKESFSPFAILAQFANERFDMFDNKLLSLFIQKMPNQFIGKTVLLNDGTLAQVRYIMPNDIEYPIVDIDGKILQTDETLYCTRIVSA